MAGIPQHDNIRKLKGDPNKDRYANGLEIDGVDVLPDPPDWFDVQHVKLYEKKGGQMMAHNMLTELDVEVLQTWVLLKVKLDKMWQLGETPGASLLNVYKSFKADLGLTPMSRQKFKNEKTQKSANKYAKSKPPKK